MMKRFMSFLLFVVMAAGLCAPALAAEAGGLDGDDGFYVVGDAGGLKDTGETTAEGRDPVDPGSAVPGADAAVAADDGAEDAHGAERAPVPPVSAALDLAAEDTYDPAWDDTRYLNQNNWYQNTYWVVENGDEQNHRVNDAVTVWYAGFSEFRQASMAGMTDRLVPGDAHVDSVRMSHSVGGASVGTKYDVPEGDGTDACSGGAPRLQDVFPDAEPGTLADYNADDNAYPAAHDYMPCGREDATHLAVKWTINGFPGPDVGLVAKGTYNWDAVHGLHPDLLVRDGNG